MIHGVFADDGSISAGREAEQASARTSQSLVQRTVQAVSGLPSKLMDMIASPPKLKSYPSMWELPYVSDEEVKVPKGRKGAGGKKDGKVAKGRGGRSQSEGDDGGDGGYWMSGGLGEEH